MDAPTGIKTTQMRRAILPGLLIALCLIACPAVLQAVRIAAADNPAPSTSAVMGKKDCTGFDARHAREAAKAAFRRSQYRQAGQCYLVAGDKAKADLSFIRATAAESATTKRQLAANANQVKRQFRQLREAFAAH
jgi:hypothetical protein